MIPSHLPRDVYRLMIISPIALPVCLLGLLIALWFGPRDPTYVIVGSVIGLITTSLWLVYWKYRQAHTGAIFFFLLAIGIVSIGYRLALGLTFGDTRDLNNLWLAIQYGAIILGIFFTTLWLFQKRIATW